MAETSISTQLKELAIAVLEADGQDENVPAPIVENVETESLKTKASSGGDVKEAELKERLKALATAVLSEDKDDAAPAPVVENVETESLKTKASSGR